MIEYKIESISDAIYVSNVLYNEGNFRGAMAAIEIGFKLTDREKPTKDEARKLSGIAGDIYGELGANERALFHYAQWHYIKMHLNNNLFKGQEPQDTITLFQFRRFSEYALANLMNKELTLSRPSQMNDIVDSLVFSWLESPSYGKTALHKRHLEPFRQSFNDYRITSFSCDNPSKNQYSVKNTLMWAHYAADHSGFCVEYCFDKNDFQNDNQQNGSASRLMRIKYINPNVAPVNFESLECPISIELAFLTKSNDWEYENEVRLIQYKPKNGAVREQYKLSDETRIVAVYFGYRCVDSNIAIIKKLLEGKDVRYYKMDIDFSNIHRLKYHEI